jgi:hypothetical protein
MRQRTPAPARSRPRCLSDWNPCKRRVGETHCECSREIVEERLRPLRSSAFTFLRLLAVAAALVALGAQGIATASAVRAAPLVSPFRNGVGARVAATGMGRKQILDDYFDEMTKGNQMSKSLLGATRTLGEGVSGGARLAGLPTNRSKSAPRVRAPPVP